MLMMVLGLCEVHDRLHDGAILDDEFPHIAGSSSAGLLTAKKYDSLSIIGIFRFLVIFIRLWSGNGR